MSAPNRRILLDQDCFVVLKLEQGAGKHPIWPLMCMQYFMYKMSVKLSKEPKRIELRSIICVSDFSWLYLKQLVVNSFRLQKVFGICIFLFLLQIRVSESDVPVFLKKIHELIASLINSIRIFAVSININILQRARFLITFR